MNQNGTFTEDEFSRTKNYAQRVFVDEERKRERGMTFKEGGGGERKENLR